MEDPTPRHTNLSALPTSSAAPLSLPYSCQRCGKIHQLTRKDPIKCTSCRHRIMYKLRTISTVVIDVE